MRARSHRPRPHHRNRSRPESTQRSHSPPWRPFHGWKIRHDRQGRGRCKSNLTRHCSPRWRRRHRFSKRLWHWVGRNKNNCLLEPWVGSIASSKRCSTSCRAWNQRLGSYPNWETRFEWRPLPWCDGQRYGSINSQCGEWWTRWYRSWCHARHPCAEAAKAKFLPEMWFRHSRQHHASMAQMERLFRSSCFNATWGFDGNILDSSGCPLPQRHASHERRAWRCNLQGCEGWSNSHRSQTPSTVGKVNPKGTWKGNPSRDGSWIQRSLCSKCWPWRIRIAKERERPRQAKFGKEGCYEGCFWYKEEKVGRHVRTEEG